MTQPRTIQSYASPKKNARLLANPKTDITQVEWNLLVNDVGQMTQVATKLWCRFATVTSGAVAVSAFAAQWGQGAASAPSVTRTSAGVYVVSTPTSWATPGTYTYSLDPDNQVVTKEQVIFLDSSASVDQAVASEGAAFCRTTRANYQVTVYVYNASAALSDLGGGVNIRMEAR